MATNPGTALRRLLAFPAYHPAFHNLIQELARPVGGLKAILSEMAVRRGYDRVLDYGCGEGLFCQAFDPAKYLGYDIDERRVAYAGARYRGYRFTSRMPESFATFDLVLFNGVLHHMRPDDVAAVFDRIGAESPDGAGLFLIEPLPADAHESRVSALLLRLECLLNGARPALLDAWLGYLRGRDYAVTSNDIYKHYCVARLTLGPRRPQG